MGTLVDYVFIGDDFTGASDTLSTLARAGRRVRLFLDPPDSVTLGGESLDAVGVATELRALPPDAITAQIDALAPMLEDLSPRIVHYKVCSTFDSHPEVGSIGAAVAALERHIDPALVAIVGGQPSLGRYCAFGNLFARGPDDKVHRIDRHPVMRDHPITPMMEADLRVHLARQGFPGLGHIALPAVEKGPAALKAHIEDHARAGEGRILFDACTKAHLDTIGAALADSRRQGRPLLVIGASSVAEALAGDPRSGEGAMPISGRRREGPCLVVAGSRSRVTEAQVRAARSFNHMPIHPQDLSDDLALERFANRCAAALGAGGNTLAYLVAEGGYGQSGADLSRRLADLVASVLDRQFISALGVAGGDTSSILVRRLGFSNLVFERQLDAGVAICIAGSDIKERDGMRLMLKGGQVGSERVFDRFVSAMDIGNPAAPPDL